MLAQHVQGESLTDGDQKTRMRGEVRLPIRRCCESAFFFETILDYGGSQRKAEFLTGYRGNAACAGVYRAGVYRGVY